MHRTDVKDKPKNPIKYYIKFSGEEGVYHYWDGEKSKDVKLEELEFVLVKTMSSVTGWVDKKGAIYSNLISYASQPLMVRVGKEVIAEGVWSDIKSAVKESGGSFTTNLICLAKIDDEFVPCNILFKGSCLRNWMAFNDQCSIKEIFNSVVKSHKGAKQKKGRVEYYAPDFSLQDLPEDVEALANEFDSTQLKPYLDA